MYLTFFGFSENPFNLTPDPRFLFLSEKHKEALGHLLYGIRERKGFILITGEVGTGKTILSRTLLNELARDGNTRTALILNPGLSEIELLKTVNEEFGIPSQGNTKKELIDELNNFLIDSLVTGKNAVLVIDEAQNLAPSVLEQIRLLSNLETEREKLLQIILLGQTELEAVLQFPRLRQLNQRISVRSRLSPLDFAETCKYMQHRLAFADGQDKVVFTRLASERIFKFTQGNPRRINILADRVLLAAYARGTRKITGALVKKTIGELKSPPLAYEKKTFRSKLLLYSSLLAVFVVLIMSGFYLYRSGFIRSHFQSISPTDSMESLKSSNDKDQIDSRFQKSGDTGSVNSVNKESKESEDDKKTLSALAEHDQRDNQREEGEKITTPAALGTDQAQLASESTSRGSAGRSNTETEYSEANRTEISARGSNQEELNKKSFEVKVLASKQLSTSTISLWPVKENLEWLRKENSLSKNLKLVAQVFGYYIEEITTIRRVLDNFKIPFFIELESPNENGEYFLLLDRPGPEGGVIVFSARYGEVAYTLESLKKIWDGKTLIPIKESRGPKDFLALLKFGMKGEQVSILQTGLKELMYLTPEVNGHFDENTLSAVKEFQRDYLLQSDGYAGPRTKLLLFLLTGKI